MTTDPRPRRNLLKAEYEASERLATVPGPRPEELAAQFDRLSEARDAEDRTGLEEACRLILGRLSEATQVSVPVLKLLGPRPHRTREGRLSYELFGDYTFEQARIRLWTRTAIQKQWASSRTLLSTL